MTQALEGIKILDLSRVPPGDFCTMFLGDMGAEVLKIEPPPDMARRAGSGLSPIGEVRRMEAAYNPLNRNKKSMGLNLRSEEGCHIFYRLTEKADVIVEGFRPGVVKRLGVDYETVMKINPRIIYCSISGYGQDGPYQNLPGHDINYISIGGVLGLISEKERRPVIPLNLVADYAGGALHATMGILTALVARERTGKGQYVDISMTDCVVSLLSGTAQNYFAVV